MIFEDDKEIKNKIQSNLRREGYEVLDGGCIDFNKNSCLVITSEEHLSKIKNKNIPVIVLVESISDNNIHKFTELGIEDFIIKPICVKNLVKRVNFVLKKCDSKKVNINGKTIDCFIFKPDKNLFIVDDKEIQLTPMESKIICYFLRNQGDVISRETLLRDVWGYQHLPAKSRTIDIHIQRLRKKLKQYGNIIRSVYGVGYVFETNNKLSKFS